MWRDDATGSQTILRNKRLNDFLFRLDPASIRTITQSGDPVSGAVLVQIWYEAEIGEEANG